MRETPENLLENGTFTLTDEQGNAHDCEILFTFSSDEGEVIAYTDNSEDENGCLRVFASVLGEPRPNGDANLLPIENDETWDAVDAALSELCGDEE